MLYVSCLRALPGWQQQASGTVLDLVAAKLMARISSESFDEAMTWNMFRRGFEYAQRLGLHRIDSDKMYGEVSSFNLIPDGDRKVFWELLSGDIFFRLIFDTPPSITGDPWKVNLPWLDANGQGTPEATSFFIISQITLILLRFFDIIGNGQTDAAEMLIKTEEMCQELMRMYEKWDVDPERNNTVVPDTWLMSEVALMGYTSFIFMLRKITTLYSTFPKPTITDHSSSDSHIMVDAARHIIGVTANLLEKYPTSPALSLSFGMYRSYIAFAYFIRHILCVSDITPYKLDIKALTRIEDCLVIISRVDIDYSPFLQAIQVLNKEIKGRFSL